MPRVNVDAIAGLQSFLKIVGIRTLTTSEMKVICMDVSTKTFELSMIHKAEGVYPTTVSHAKNSSIGIII